MSHSIIIQIFFQKRNRTARGIRHNFSPHGANCRYEKFTPYSARFMRGDALSVSSCGRGLFDVGKRLVRAFGSPHRYARGKAALSRTRRRALSASARRGTRFVASRRNTRAPSSARDALPPFHFGGRGKYPLTLLSASPRQTLRFLSQGLGRLSGQRRLFLLSHAFGRFGKGGFDGGRFFRAAPSLAPGKASASPQPRASVNGGAVYINRRISV